MITLEQIKQLETRVHSAVARIRSLTVENTTLKDSLSDYERRIDELENLVKAFKSEQGEIEAGIIAALSQLDGLEDAVAETAPDPPSDQRSEPEVAVTDVDAASANVDPKSLDEPNAEGPIVESFSHDSDTKNSADEPENSRIAPTGDSPPREGVDLSSDLSGPNRAVEPNEDDPELDIF